MKSYNVYSVSKFWILIPCFSLLKVKWVLFSSYLCTQLLKSQNPFTPLRLIFFFPQTHSPVTFTQIPVYILLHRNLTKNSWDQNDPGNLTSSQDGVTGNGLAHPVEMAKNLTKYVKHQCSRHRTMSDINPWEMGKEMNSTTAHWRPW